MKRKDIRIGTRVVPSGRGFTKHWNLSQTNTGTVIRMGQHYITVEWDKGEVSPNMRPMHLEEAKEQ